MMIGSKERALFELLWFTCMYIGLPPLPPQMEGGTLPSQLRRIMFDGNKNPLMLSKNPDKMKSLMSAFRNHEGIVSLRVAMHK